jgi:hypothetical protein
MDAQRESSETYIKSQAHEGWRAVRAAYNDGSFSGGTLSRPTLQRLPVDIYERRIDVVVGRLWDLTATNAMAVFSR